MQDFSEQIGSVSEYESAKTPNWVADAGTSTWQPDSQASFVRASYTAGSERPTADLEVFANIGLIGDSSNAFKSVNSEWTQHTFYEPPQPPKQVRKPYEQNTYEPQVPPLQIDPRPLDEQIIPKDTPGREPGRKFDAPGSPDGKKPGGQEVPTIYEPLVRVPPVVREGNRVLIPTFLPGDADLSDKNPVQTKAYDINSPEAKLYLQSRDSIVKITTDKTNSEGKDFTAYGSGFFVTENGQIATANHVIDGAKTIKVTTADGHVYNARVKETNVGGESAVIELTDIAPGERFKPLPLRDSAAGIKPGEKLVSIGHPNGVEDIVMSPGEMVKRERFVASNFSYPKVNPNAMFIHASTRTQGGNSGGPLIDSEGRAVGLTNFRHGDASGEFVGIDDVRSLITDPKKGQLSDNRSFFFPSTLQIDNENVLKGLSTVFAGGNNLIAFGSRGNIQYGRAIRGMNTFASGLAGGYAITELPGDIRAFKSALNYGTTAERVSTGIDVGGDGLMIVGALAGIASKRYAPLGSVLVTVGASSRFGNAVFGDRRFK